MLTKVICIVLYCTVLYCIVLYCIVLYCIVLYANLPYDFIKSDQDLCKSLPRDTITKVKMCSREKGKNKASLVTH